MEAEHINLLTLDNYIIKSTITKDIYMDENFVCHIFDKKSSAEFFIKDNKITDVQVILNDNKKAKDFCENLYSTGFRKIIFYKKDKEIEISVEKPTFQIQYNNPYASAMLLRLKQTGAKKYLRALYNAKFFAPVIVKDREIAHHPIIKYSYASVKKSGTYYLLFSTLKEFEKWNLSQGNVWKPLKVSIKDFDRIRNNNPILLDSLSKKIILNKECIRIIKEGENGIVKKG